MSDPSTLVVDFASLAKLNSLGDGKTVTIEVKGAPIVFDIAEYAKAYAQARRRLLNKHMREAGLPAASTLAGDAGRKRSRRLALNLWAGMQCHLRMDEKGHEIYLKGRYHDRSRQRFVNARLKSWSKQFAEADHRQALKRASASLVRREKKRLKAAAVAGETP